MARETRAVWVGRIARWQRSGLTAERFAGREGINPRTLTFWKWKLGRQPTDHAASDGPRDPQGNGTVGFVEVLRATAAPTSPAPAFEVVLPDGYRIGVAPGFDGATLRALLDVLEGRR
jgi:hypothetical protein